MQHDHCVDRDGIVDAVLVACRRKNTNFGVGSRPPHVRKSAEALNSALEMGADVLSSPWGRLLQQVVPNFLKILLDPTMKNDPQAHGLLRRSSLSASTRFSPRFASASAGSSM